MRLPGFVLTLCLVAWATPAGAWGNHSVPAYRAFERMPEVATANPVVVEPLENFLKAEERTIEALLASQEAWAIANLNPYPARPDALAFIADPSRTDEARRTAFLMALRVSPTAKLALYFQPDLLAQPGTFLGSGPLLPHSAVNTLPPPPVPTYRFLALKPGDLIAPLNVLASACDEADYGLDINLWSDSPTEWGKLYGFGPLPFGNPALANTSQAPFHMGFMHENQALYLAAPFIKRTFPRLRSYQYSTLSALAFRTGHPYWGWRFAGLSLHYLQDLTQPYHASLAPGHSLARLLSVNAMALVGMHGLKDDMIVLLSNRHLALEKYQTELLALAAKTRQDTALERALRNPERDRNYPEWGDRYLQDIVSAQAAAGGPALVDMLLAALPATFVSDPGFDFGVHEAGINMSNELAKSAPADRARLDAAIAELMGNFGAHSRNALRGILKASVQP